MKLKLEEGQAYVSGKSPQKARELIAAAEEAGIDVRRILTTSGGYIVPKELGGEGGDATRLEIGHGLNTQKYKDGIDDVQVEAVVASELLSAIQPVADAGKVEGALLNQKEPTGAETEGKAIGNGSQTVGDSAILAQNHEATDPTNRQSTDTSDDEAPTGSETPDVKDFDPEAPINPDEKEQQETEVNPTFDPADHKVEDVNAYLAAADENERQRVLDAEAKGKDRKTVAVPEESK